MDGSAVHFFCEHHANLAIPDFHKCIFQPGQIRKGFFRIDRYENSSRPLMTNMEQKLWSAC